MVGLLGLILWNDNILDYDNEQSQVFVWKMPATLVQLGYSKCYIYFYDYHRLCFLFFIQTCVI